jgi:biotin carboxylase
VTTRPVVLVGFVLAALKTLAFRPEGSVVFVEEPDVVRKRDVHAKVEGSALVREVIEWEHHLAGAADEFYNRYPDLDPTAVLPLVEYATPFAARLAERYGLPGAGYGAVQLLRDKSLLRRVAASAGIANPASERASSPEDVRAFLRAHPGKVVVKPANRQGSIGTTILADESEVDGAWQRCLVMDEGVFVPDRQMPLVMLVEQFVEGHEFSVEMLVRDGQPVFRSVTDKLLFSGTHPIEQGHVVPADIPVELSERLFAETTRLLAAVGFRTGVVHCEWIVSDGVPYLVECAGRFGGDGIVDLVNYAYEIDLVQLYYAVMAGEPLPAQPTRAVKGASVRFLTSDPGIVEAVDGLEEARAVPGVVDCDVSVAPGDRAPEMRSSWDRIGHATVVAATPAEAERIAAAAMAKVSVKVRPDVG